MCLSCKACRGAPPANSLQQQGMVHRPSALSVMEKRWSLGWWARLKLLGLGEKMMPNGAAVSSQGWKECRTADLQEAGAYLPLALSARGEVGDASSNSICTQAIKVHLTLHKTHKKAHLKCSVMHTSLELAMSFLLSVPQERNLLYEIMATASKHCCWCRLLWLPVGKTDCSCISVYKENKAKGKENTQMNKQTNKNPEK